MGIYIGILIILSLAYGFLGWLFGKALSTESKSSVTRIDDDNWLVNGEFVSFEKDTPLLRLQQETEDSKHYLNYEIEKLQKDREQVLNDWLKTKQAINKYPDLKGAVTEEKLKAITDEYQTYVFMCGKLDGTTKPTMLLTKEEFLIKQENGMYCVDISSWFHFRKALNTYTIHNEETAKYTDGNMTDLMQKEFETKWY